MFNVRQHLEGISKGYQISGIGRLIADASQKSLQIVDWIQILTDFFPGDIIHIQLFDGILPF